MVTVLVLGVLAVTMRRYLYNLLPYSASSFGGDGTIRDSGFWTYPRYEITFPKIPLNRSGRHAYSVKGLPNQLTFCLRVPWQGSGTKVSELESRLRRLASSTNVKVGITDDSGLVVCEHSSLLSEWVLSVSVDRAKFWHQACRDLPFRRHHQFTVAIQVDCSDTAVEKVVAEPIFQGGGNELP